MSTIASSLRVVIAPDSFKGSLNAVDLSNALATGWRSVRPHDDVVLLPQADGGEGTLEAIVSVEEHATWKQIDSVRGPDQRAVTGRWLSLDNGTAVIELAQTSGLPLMKRLDAGGATTAGLGQVIAGALDDGAASLVIGLGGSASTDGGAGALRALGARLLDRQGRHIAEGGAALADLHTVDLTDMRTAPAAGVQLLTDTTAVLCGPNGAAQVFAGQKGASPLERSELNDALAHFAGCLGKVADIDPQAPGSGAAGGTAFGLAAWGATIVPGAARIAQLTRLDTEFGRADVILTGEGRFDDTSLTGKLVGSVLQRCIETGTRSIVVAGQITTDPQTLAVSLTDLAGSSEQALANPVHWARVAAAKAANAV